MTYNYSYPQFLDLHVKDRIGKTDADRQSRTARTILERLTDQPGLILADEVGMGKTFVALAVAISVYLRDKKPVIIMIPPNLIKKWPNDFKLFINACITDEKIKTQMRCGTATKPEEFFKLLDDDEETRSAVIFLTHGALTRNLSDGWLKLAIIQRSLYRRKDTGDVYKSLGKYAGVLLEMMYMENRNRNVDIWTLLLNSGTKKWKNIIIKNKFEIEGFDDPVPKLFVDELDKLETVELNSLYKQLRSQLPKRDSENIKSRLKGLREILGVEAKNIWARCLSKISLDLPLLIFDEAHHLKNETTQLVTRLFHNSIAEEDAGILTNQFDRMLFLTATPFQLGHHELYHVLERFNTINWNSSQKPTLNLSEYKEELGSFLNKLDDSQIVARKLDNAWSKLSIEDLDVDGIRFENIYEWWKIVQAKDTIALPKIQAVKDGFDLAKDKLKQVEPLLKKYIIRHLKPKEFSEKYFGIARRTRLPGNLIIKTAVEKTDIQKGLEISEESILPFLLAARLTTLQQEKRPVFAEGLASSYEAFRFTRHERLQKVQEKFTDIDDELIESEQVTDKISIWYLDQLDEALSFSLTNGSNHPKIKATVDKAMELWDKGEKVLIFCHYIATGKALRKYLSHAMKMNIKAKGSNLLKCLPEEVFDTLERHAERLSDKDSPIHKECTFIINNLLYQFSDLENNRNEIIDVILRYMRTPSFQIRFASAYNSEVGSGWIEKSLESKDQSGVTLKEMINGFLTFLNNRKEDREEYLSALKSIQPGGIRVKDINIEDFDSEDEIDNRDKTVMANVRLCYGATKQESRQKLMKTFNTPFFPDILITSNVMAEGVDLHLNCRHIIHHDLCWNPSTLEQRTGRIDRIGAKAEKCGQPINIYLPYISETQDEKMYKVVTERERWFNIVMGDVYKTDAASTDKYSERIPFPEELARELSFNLEIIN